MASVKLIAELDLKELKQELRWRGLKCFERNNETLRERLRQALQDEDEDPDSYLFEFQPDIRELLGTKLDEVNEQVCTLIRQIGTSSSLDKIDETFGTVMNQTAETFGPTFCKTDETFGTVMNKTDELMGAMMNRTGELMATISRSTNNPSLNGDAVDCSALDDCGSEPCKLGSYDQKPDIRCDNNEHRSDVNVIPACTQAFNNNCADEAGSQGECEHRKNNQQSVLNQRTTNWCRRKRHAQAAMKMTPSRWQYRPTAPPTDRPPPASMNLHSPCYEVVCPGRTNLRRGQCYISSGALKCVYV